MDNFFPGLFALDRPFNIGGGSSRRLVALDEYFSFRGPVALRAGATIAKAVVRRCTVCKCTDGRACDDGCYWTTPTTCSNCLFAPPMALPTSLYRARY